MYKLLRQDLVLNIKMEIVEKDFKLVPVSDDSSLWNLNFMKRVKKRDTGEYVMELGDTLYGLTLSSALLRIAKHRTAKKYAEDNISLFQFLKDYQKSYKEMVKLCRESLPEDFDTGD